MKTLGITLMKEDFSLDEQIALLKETIRPPFGCKMTVDLYDGVVDFELYQDYSSDFKYKFVINSNGKKEFFNPT